MVEALTYSDYTRGDAQISVTQLIDSPRIARLKKKFADQMETITTKTNPVGYYNGNPLDPEYWPITPGYFNGALQTGTGIFKFTLELTNWNGQLGGGSGNFSKFEIEAQ